ncbi:MFS general substrate transporter [Thozetella sp. PMI_491]|nr:MFS general substrate transporter [Thozetella sp. PMI_491]
MPSGPIRSRSGIRDTEKPKYNADGRAATWLTIPRKGQLGILLYARFTEPLAQTAFSSYMYYQLASFDRGLSDKEIALQAGLLSAVFSMGACVTAVVWGRLSQVPSIGRKGVIVAGLFIAGISCVGIGFATSFYHILLFQMMGGIASGNVGVIRTIVPEIIPTKSFHARAFSLLPFCTTFGSITGPFLAGILIKPADDYSDLCGENVSACSWVDRWPFALPMIVNAIMVAFGVIMVAVNLEETLPGATGPLVLPRARWLKGRVLSFLFGRPKPRFSYRLVAPGTDTGSDQDLPRSDGTEYRDSSMESYLEEKETDGLTGAVDPEELESTLPGQSSVAIAWRVVAKLVMSLHFTAYATAIAIFLPAPLGNGVNAAGEANPGHGLGFSVQEIGTLTMGVTLLGIPIQLLLFPRLHDTTGSRNCLQLLLPFSTVAYLGFMLLSQPPGSDVLRLLFAAALMALHVACRTICQPSALLLINDACEDAAVRAKVHSITHSCDSAVSALGLILGGVLIRAGILAHFPGLAWLIMACIAVLNSAIVSYFIM